MTYPYQRAPDTTAVVSFKIIRKAAFNTVFYIKIYGTAVVSGAQATYPYQRAY